MKNYCFLCLCIAVISSFSISAMIFQNDEQIILNSATDLQLFFNLPNNELAKLRSLELRNFDFDSAKLIILFLSEHKAVLNKLIRLSVHACSIELEQMRQIEANFSHNLQELEYSCIRIKPQMLEFIKEINQKDKVSLVQIIASKNVKDELLKIATIFRVLYFNFD